MINNKNNVSLYAEEITIDQNTEQIQEIFNKLQQPTSTNFIQIKAEHICSTKPSWEGKPLSERYSFTHGEKWVWIDIPHDLMEKLGLEKGQDIQQPLYLDPVVLTHPKTYKGITINEEEIFIKRPFTINNLVSTLQKWLTEINTLKENIANLQTEKDNLINQTNTFQTEITNLKEQKNQIQQSLERNLIGSLFKNKQKNKRISELNDSLSFLRGLLTNENREITNLITQQDNLQIQINGLDQQLIAANTLIANNNNEITRLEKRIEDLEAERDNRPNITLVQWNNDYSKRPTQQQLTNLQTQLDSVRTELNNTKNDRNRYQKTWNNHTCPSTYCSRTHTNESSYYSSYKKPETYEVLGTRSLD